MPYLPQTSAVRARREIMNGDKLSEEMKSLETQVDALFKKVNEANRFFWPALVSPDRHLTAQPESFSTGSMEEMQVCLKFNYDAWAETTGAIDFVQVKMQGRD